MNELLSSKNLRAEFDYHRRQLQPPVQLGRSSLVKRIGQLSPLIDQLKWNSMYNNFWNCTACNSGNRQHVAGQSFDGKTNMTGDMIKPQSQIDTNVSALPAAKAENTIFNEFLSYFRGEARKPYTTVKRGKCSTRPAVTQRTGYAPEKNLFANQLKIHRNPYEIEHFQQKLRRLKEVQHQRWEDPSYAMRLVKLKNKCEQVPNAHKPPVDRVCKQKKPNYFGNMHEDNPWIAGNANVVKLRGVTSNNTTYLRGAAKDNTRKTIYQRKRMLDEATGRDPESKNTFKMDLSIENAHLPARANYQSYMLENKTKSKPPNAIRPIDGLHNKPIFDKLKEPASNTSDVSFISHGKSKKPKRKHKSREARMPKGDQKSDAKSEGTKQYRKDLQTLRNYEDKLKTIKKLMKHKKRELKKIHKSEFEQDEGKMQEEWEYDTNLKRLKAFEHKIIELKETNRKNKQSRRKSIHVDSIEELSKHLRRLLKYNNYKPVTEVDVEVKSAAIKNYKKKSMINGLTFKANEESSFNDTEEQTQLIDEKSEKECHNSARKSSANRKEKHTKSDINYKKDSLHTLDLHQLKTFCKMIRKLNKIKKQMLQKDRNEPAEVQLQKQIQNLLVMFKSIEQKVKIRRLAGVTKLVKRLKKMIEDVQRSPETLIAKSYLQQFKYRVVNLLYLKKIEVNRSQLKKLSLDGVTKLKAKPYFKYSKGVNPFARAKRPRICKHTKQSCSTSLARELSNSIIKQDSSNEEATVSTDSETDAFCPADSYAEQGKTTDDNIEYACSDTSLRLIDAKASPTIKATDESHKLEGNKGNVMNSFLAMNKVVVYNNPYGRKKSADTMKAIEKQSKTSNETLAAKVFDLQAQPRNIKSPVTLVTPIRKSLDMPHIHRRSRLHSLPTVVDQTKSLHLSDLMQRSIHATAAPDQSKRHLLLPVQPQPYLYKRYMYQI